MPPAKLLLPSRYQRVKVHKTFDDVEMNNVRQAVSQALYELTRAADALDAGPRSNVWIERLMRSQEALKPVEKILRKDKNVPF